MVETRLQHRLSPAMILRCSEHKDRIGRLRLIEGGLSFNSLCHIKQIAEQTHREQDRNNSYRSLHRVNLKMDPSVSVTSCKVYALAPLRLAGNRLAQCLRSGQYVV